jgi:nucleoside-diphosphate-sugar epimerase
MKILVAGAGGAVGKRLIPRLVANGHDVVGLTRSASKAGDIVALGAEPAIADALDRAAVIQAVMRAEPEVVIHQMTALSALKNVKHFDREFELTNRLRTTGTDYLVDAAQKAGVRRLIAQSYGNWNYERVGDGLKTESDRLDPDPPAEQAQSLAAIRHLEDAVVGADGLEGVALRYGNFYGPGNGIALDGELADQVRKRRFPIVGDGGGVWSFCHIDDVASAAIAALDHGEPGVYNVCDDEPIAARDWLPELAKALGAKPPRTVPVWLGRLAAGEVGVSMLTQIKGVSNAKAKRELGWTPAYPSVRVGFHAGLASDLPIPQNGPDRPGATIEA